MLNIEALSDIELKVLLRGVELLNNCKVSLSEKAVLIELSSGLHEEVNKRKNASP